MQLLFIVLVSLFGLYLAWNIGANDVANSMGCAVGSRSLSAKWAILLAGVFEFSGAVLVGSHVTDTVRKGIVDPSALFTSIPGILERDAATLLVLGMVSALLSSALWLNLATWLAMPVSTTHSIVGAVAGFGVVAAGWSAVSWGKLGQIVLSWFISPVVGGIVAFVLFRLIIKYVLGRERPVAASISFSPLIAGLVVTIMTLAILYKGMGHILSARLSWITGNFAIVLAALLGILTAAFAKRRLRRALAGKDELPLRVQLVLVERTFAPLVVATSCTVAFSHGANDVANAIGPLAAVVDIVRTGTVQMKVHVSSWILILGGAGIVIGLGTYGYKVIHTVGSKITQLTPSRGVAANIATMGTVLVCTRLSLPVSTTHTLVGAVIGIGLARGIAAINRETIRNICSSWVVTVPAAAVLSIILFLAGRLLVFDWLRSILG